MRTTVTLDPDTEQIVRARMKAKGVCFKKALNDTIREGAEKAIRRKPYVMKPLSLGVPLVDLTHANRIAADLEDAELIAEMRRGS